jgi:FtsH-binding integral membrane protein
VIIAATLVFCLTALAGWFPLRALLRDIPARWRFIFLHGGLALSGLVLLIVAVWGSESSAPAAALFTLCLTAGGGLILFGLRRLKAPLHPGMALVHPLIGLLGIGILVLFLLGVEI